MNSGFFVNNSSEERGALSATLSGGQLNMTVNSCDMEPESLFSLAERSDKSEPFIFLSRVLGRHIPARPSAMNEAAVKLAGKISSDLPSPVLVIGVAESAIGLGAAVHRELAKHHTDCLYVASTRHPIEGELLAIFEGESNSHLLYEPQCLTLRRLMMEARSLVLVDDESSTGTTFVNLVNTLRDVGLDQVEEVVTATFTDWSGDRVAKALGGNVTSVALLKGDYSFHKNEAPLPLCSPAASFDTCDFWPINPKQDWGRLGTVEHLDTLAPRISVTDGERILVIGTGEFVWRPFLLAERLEKAGAEVSFISTSRAPVATGPAIKSSLCFADNYGLGMANYLYNVTSSDYDRIFICSETPAAAFDSQLIADLDANVITEELGLNILFSRYGRAH